ncbi:LysR family transcriptional regulator [Nocardia uniformis]|uniref:LysR family transcriptional regulator n=1 Tax=Nocardia uniformis TaxID=53432 RepID=A0A849C194_9NOCA|nr:LysR family transcriptional regulator [Nocardia uniformis]NNH68769.1 LysR family transcriptional regulator [Nocardia uniformis]
MELKHLTTFLSVARHLNFTRAAHELGYAQSSVTAQIKALEADLGVRLFERLGRRVALTDSGRELCAHAPALLSHAQQAREAVHGAADDPRKIKSTLRIAAPESLCAYRLPPVLRCLQDRFPLLQVVFGPAGRVPLVTSLSNGTLDVGFLLEETVDEPMLHAERIAHEPMRLVAPPAHRLCSCPSVTTEDLASETLLLIEQGCAQRAVMDRELRNEGIHPTTMEFVSMEALKRCATAGLGVAMLPAMSVVDEVGRGELVVLPWTRRVVLDIFLVRHKDRRPTRVLREITQIAGQHWTPSGH